MFTGIVEEIGEVKLLRKQGACIRLEIQAEKSASDVKIGDSICVNGACLTVVTVTRNSIAFDIMSETLNISTLKYFRVGQKVNCERALKVGDRIGGHFVSGHIDCIGTIRTKRISRGNLELGVGVPVSFLKYVSRKGSIAVDGVSLTISDVRRGSFFVCLIPHTAKNTISGNYSAGARVNIEFDMLAKSS